MTVVATAGHVDHGKSSLVLALTGTDPDRFEEEKRRGLTIDLGFAHTSLPSGAALSFVDVPGHVRFLRNMLAGVGGVAACVFVVAATEGWKPQSEEHLRILELLGLDAGIVVLTKIDLVDEEMLEIAQLDVADHLAGSFLEDAPMLPVSATTGAGLDELRAALDELVAGVGAATDTGRPRLWVDRVFAPTGSGTVVTGTLVGGALRLEQQVAIEPGGHRARVRGLQTAFEAVDQLGPGTRAAVNLSGVDHNDLARGHAVIEPDRWLLTDRVDAELSVLPTLDHEVSRRGSYVAYIGSGEHAVQLRVLGSEALAPATTGAVRLFLPVELPLIPGDRYVLRETGRDETVGGGQILDIAPVLPAATARPDRSVGRLVSERRRVTVDELELLTGRRFDAADHDGLDVVGDWVTTSEVHAAVAADVVARVTEAGPAGIDLAAFDDFERAVLPTIDDVFVDGGLVRPADAVDPYVDHPFLAALEDGRFAPPSADDWKDPATGAGLDRADLRELVRRGHAVQRDGLVFHTGAIDDAAVVAARLLAEHPEGFTVAQFRDATGASRKFALPLVSELDARGITRRREDLRIAGPRLPELDQHRRG